MPKDKVLVPGVITHASNIVEHPELIAERIMRFAKLVGRENVIAGADCGFSSQALYSHRGASDGGVGEIQGDARGSRNRDAASLGQSHGGITEENQPAGEESEEKADQSTRRRAKEEAMNRLLAGLAAAGIMAAPASAADAIKIGFVNTFSGPAAVIGNDMRDGFNLGLENLNRQMAGRPVEVIYEDDTSKPEVGKQKTDKLIESGPRRLSDRVCDSPTCCWPHRCRP